MKNVRQKLFSILAIATVVFVTSCGEDDSVTAEIPSVTVTATLGDETTSLSSGGEITAGESVIFTVNGTAPGGFNTLFVSGSGSITINRNDLNLEAGATETGPIVLDPIPTTAANAGSSALYNFVVVDELDQQSDTLKFSFSIVSPDVETYEMVLLGAQGNTNEGFYNAKENIRYTYADARDASTVTSSPVDLAYYWGATNNSTIAALDDTGLDNVYTAVNLPISNIFGTRNATRFVSSNLTATEFDGVANNAQLESAAVFELGGESSATGLSADDVLAFEFAEARGGGFGLIKIVSVDDTNGNGTITIEVKVAGE